MGRKCTTELLGEALGRYHSAVALLGDSREDQPSSMQKHSPSLAVLRHGCLAQLDFSLLQRRQHSNWLQWSWMSLKGGMWRLFLQVAHIGAWRLPAIAFGNMQPEWGWAVPASRPVVKCLRKGFSEPIPYAENYLNYLGTKCWGAYPKFGQVEVSTNPA